jgi:hypothetical protein
MGFLTPWFLGGLALLAVPLLIHLTRRDRAAPVPFPSLMFVRRVPQPTTARRRLRDLPLLLMRALALALLAAAFARPLLDRARGWPPPARAGVSWSVLLDRLGQTGGARRDGRGRRRRAPRAGDGRAARPVTVVTSTRPSSRPRPGPWARARRWTPRRAARGANALRAGAGVASRSGRVDAAAARGAAGERLPARGAAGATPRGALPGALT